jgi:membrane-associated phospholipid phosphatase
MVGAPDLDMWDMAGAMSGYARGDERSGKATTIALPGARGLALWSGLYLGGFLVFNALRAMANDTGVPIRTAYAVELDRLMFAGIDPVVWLQSRFFSATEVGLLAFLAVLVHASFFVAPHLVAVAALVWRRSLFSRFVLLYLAVNYAGLLIYFLLPTAPPWMAAQSGYLDGVERVVFHFGHIEAGTDPNPVAAMPSLHMAVTMLIFLWHRRVVPHLAPASLVYCGLMGVALVYLGEHYVVDLIAGILLAVAVERALARWLARRGEDLDAVAMPEAVPSTVDRSAVARSVVDRASHAPAGGDRVAVDRDRLR